MNFLRKFAMSFVHAFRGLKFAVLNERNFRVHILAIVYTLSFAAVYGLNGYEYGVLVLTFALVPAMELINTAVENAVNIETTEFNRFARIAKDTSAAAVLVAAFAAIGVAISLFSDPEKLSAAAKIIFSVPNIIWVLLSLIPAGLFLVCCRSKEETEKENKNI